MNKAIQIVCVAVVVSFASVASADSFGTGGNQFTIDFVTISGDASSANGTNISQYYNKVFTDPSNDYRMGKFEITNGQWNKFEAAHGTVSGNPGTAYDSDPYWTGPNLPTNNVSWYEAAQFVNWLNTSRGHHVAYRFSGTHAQGNYAFATWNAPEADGGTNLYRHKDAFYFLPTEDEWIKAAYWNGTDLQAYAAKNSNSLGEWTPNGGPDSDGQAAGWNYGYAYPDNRSSTNRPWSVAAGYSPEELNGTFDIMGNVWEWMESPYSDTNYGPGSGRGFRGGAYDSDSAGALKSTVLYSDIPFLERDNIGFRVASEVPEPATLSLLALGGLAMLRRRRK